MKATIGGITIEGTPQEITEYQRIQAEKAAHSKPPYAVGTPWWGVYPPTPYTPTKTTISPSVADDGSILRVPVITSGDPPGSIGSGSTTVKRCSGPCYCTGACEGRSAVSQQKWANEYNNVTASQFKDLVITI